MLGADLSSDQPVPLRHGDVLTQTGHSYNWPVSAHWDAEYRSKPQYYAIAAFVAR